jgi:hypothetical protein
MSEGNIWSIKADEMKGGEKSNNRGTKMVANDPRAAFMLPFLVTHETCTFMQFSVVTTFPPPSMIFKLAWGALGCLVIWYLVDPSVEIVARILPFMTARIFTSVSPLYDHKYDNQPHHMFYRIL